MTLFEYYIDYMTRVCEGALPTPAGIALTETDEMRRAMELQQQISAMGIPAFVKACAAAAGDEIPGRPTTLSPWRICSPPPEP